MGNSVADSGNGSGDGSGSGAVDVSGEDSYEGEFSLKREIIEIMSNVTFQNVRFGM